MNDEDSTIDQKLTLRNDDNHSLSTWVNNPYIKAATADNTRRAYRSDIRHFEAWGGLLPSTSETISLYLQHYAGALNPRTLSRRLTALKNWHHYQGFPDPTSHPAIKKTLTGILRIHAKPKAKASPLSPQDLLIIVNHLKKERTIQATRDIALLQIGYFGNFRRSELIQIEIGHICWCEEGIEILIPHSKTDQNNVGRFKVIPYGNDLFCPPTALKFWLEQAQIKEGALFRRIRKGGVVLDKGISSLSVNHILARRALQANIQKLLKLSSHSLRRGFTTHAYAAGASQNALLQQGLWKKIDTLMGYIETIDQFKENPAKNIYMLIEKNRGSKETL